MKNHNKLCFKSWQKPQMGFPPDASGKTCLKCRRLKRSGLDPLEEDMVTPSSILPWRMLWTDRANGLQSKGSLRIRHN